MQLIVLQISIISYASIWPFHQKLPIHRLVFKSSLVCSFTFRQLTLMPLTIFKRPRKKCLHLTFISDCALCHLAEFKHSVEPSLFPGEYKNALTVAHSFSIYMPIVTRMIFVVDDLLICRLGGQSGPPTHSDGVISFGLHLKSLITALRIKRSSLHYNSWITSDIICESWFFTTVELLDFDN